MGILGAVMLAVAVGALWTNKLKSHVVTVENYGDETDETETAAEKRNSSARIVMPIAPPRTQPVNDKAEAAVEVIESPLEQIPEPQVSTSSPEVNCSDAENNLKVAQTLANIGDFEGASELAQLVIESTTSSQAQRTRAAGLVSRGRSR